MEKNKAFQFFYSVMLCGFIISCVALASRLAESHCGNEFYEQISVKEWRTVNISLPQRPKSTIPENPKLPVVLAGSSSHFVQFAEEYPNAVAWLQISDTSVDYPVMLGADNQFYLKHLPNGSKNAMGSLFLDCRSDSGSLHWIIYGHNLADGKMFGMLKEYEDPNFFADHSSLIVETLDSVYICPIFSIRRVNADSDAFMLDFTNAGSFDEYINQAASESLYPIEADLDKAVKILTLSTCTERYNQRFIVQAILM